MFAVSFLLLALAPVGAYAVDGKAQSSTHILRYYDPFQDKLQGDLLLNSLVSIDPGACAQTGGTRLNSCTSRLTNR